MACLDETEIARLLDGTLASFEAARVDAHVDECARCRGLVADLALVQSGSRSKADSSSKEALSGPRHRTQAVSVDVARRYRVLELIGQGGMGQVFRALDRVTGRAVALKRVLSRAEARSSSLSALAQEFRVLATLRHPNIISVLDYGFDAERQPYFTMELLEGARPVLPWATGAPRAKQVELLGDLLRVIDYLHRRGVLHRDLKPSNVLITEGGALKVVDFGLATAADDAHSRHAAGTLPYMAPELLRGGAASEASDLYAFGVLAYEMLAGHLPFWRGRTVAEIAASIVKDEADLSLLPHVLREVIGRTLRKSPNDRPRSTAELLRDLLSTTGTPTKEPTGAHESYLVAARFTGRDEEIGVLGQALAEARLGHGSAWLVGGESGVGKSRLLEELRTAALVDGVIALRGQAVQSGGTAFHVLRGPLEVLSLHVTLSDLEASVLATVVPKLDALLDRHLRPPPEIEVQARRRRMLDVLREVVLRATEPTLILLEDLQWADAESLTLLAEIAGELSERPILLVASYRDEEAPRLPASLKVFSLLRLQRMDQGGIAQLCAAMLGPAGAEPELVSLVARETEGNAYFIVETMRALIEEAGGIEHVGRHGLPRRILAGGVEQVLERRLSQAPSEARPLLRLAAVAGRELDLSALSMLEPRLDALVQASAEAGILEMHEQQYRFSHDKLRERILREIDASELPLLHARIAESLAATYPESAAHAARTAYHFRKADRPREASFHYARAGEAALSRGASGEAEATFEQAIKLHARVMPPRLEAVRVWRGLTQAHYGLGRLSETDAALRRVCALSGAPLPESSLGLRRALAKEIMEQAARRAGIVRGLASDADAEARALAEERVLALQVQEVYVWLGQPETMLLCTLMGLNLEEAVSFQERTNYRAAAAFILSYTPLRRLGAYYLEQMAPTIVPQSPAEIVYRRVRAIFAQAEGRLVEAEEEATRAIACARACKDEVLAMHCQLQLHFAVAWQDDLPRVLAIAREIERLAVRTDNPRYRTVALLSQAYALQRQGALAEAEETLLRAEEDLPSELGAMVEANLHGIKAGSALMRGERERAKALAHAALDAAKSAPWIIPEFYLSLYQILDVYLSLGEPRRDGPQIRAALALLRQVEQSARYVEPAVWLFDGRWEAQRGRATRAATKLRRAVKLAERWHVGILEALARYALGCLGQNEVGRRHVPEGAETHFRAALTLFEQIGARCEAETTRAALSGQRFDPAVGPRCPVA